MSRKKSSSTAGTTARRAAAPSARAPRPRISYQGEPGANSHLACNEVFPDFEPLPSPTFEDAIAAVKSGEARYAMIPIENSLAGRVADIHHLLPQSGLYIVAEHFLPIRFQLMALKGVKVGEITDVYSHIHALGQCRRIIRKHGFKAHVAGDTAGAARQVAEWGDRSRAALAPRIAAGIYGLDILAEDVDDEKHNTTRFVVLSAEPEDAAPGNGLVVTTFIFNVRNVPAALYKAMGGFATNGVNMTKLESYQVNGEFVATMFYADIEGHPSDRSVRLALEELSFFSSEMRILGTYPASTFRAEIARKAAARASADAG
jgi:prephenate dehydratase